MCCIDVCVDWITGSQLDIWLLNKKIGWYFTGFKFQIIHWLLIFDTDWLVNTSVSLEWKTKRNPVNKKNGKNWLLNTVCHFQIEKYGMKMICVMNFHNTATMYAVLALVWAFARGEKSYEIFIINAYYTVNAKNKFTSTLQLHAFSVWMLAVWKKCIFYSMHFILCVYVYIPTT